MTEPYVGRVAPAQRVSNRASLGNLVSGFEFARDRRHDLETESLQNLDGIIGGPVQEDSTVRETGVFPLAALSAVTKQTVLKRTVNK